MKEVFVYTDGACSGNPGPGGWAAILKSGGHTRELSGGEADTTNNRMELTAVIEALAALKEPCRVELTSDSKYVIDSVTKSWVYGWKRKGWIKSDKKPALNVDLWERLLPLLERHDVRFHWIKGHNGHPENERCDQLAVAFYTGLKQGGRAPAPQPQAGPSPKPFVYLDNAATTRLSSAALAAMLPWLEGGWGNPSAAYRLGREARKATEAARRAMAPLLGARPEELFFTSGGTEADNWAVKGMARHLARAGKGHIVTAASEHHAVLRSAQALEREGIAVTYLTTGPGGILTAGDVAKAIRPDTALVSIAWANNEAGTVQPVREIGRLCRERGVVFHSDAVQAAGCLDIDVARDCVDLLSLSAHKFHGPKGAGALVIRKGLELPAYLDGGGQEKGRRAGTENVAAIAGMAAALAEAVEQREATNVRVAALRDRLLDGLLAIPGASLNGDRAARLPGNINVSFDGVVGESLLLELDLAGIAASAGSACTAGDSGPSHVLLAMGLPEDRAAGALRLTLGRENTEADVDYALERLPPLVEKLRGNRTMECHNAGK